ncbi:MAG: hypothetical protein SFW36_04650 [Leptolyngbyaceae cyanobacterium bins.59]|nr:hypothetical protein [Leptolyngbyaceae cyanobacterium bins.59]
MSHTMLPPDILNPDIADLSSEPGFTPARQSVSPPPWSVETYADSLMDELFEEVDRLLEGGSPFPTESRPVETIALQAVSIPKIIMPPGLASSSALAPGVTVEALATAVDPISLKKQPATSWLDRLLILGLGGATAIVGLLWLAGQRGMQLNLPFLVSQPIQKNAATTVAQTAEMDADAQFLDYIQRSLELVSQRPASSPSPVVALAPTATSNLPSVTVAANTSPAPVPSTTVLERIYIPVYQPPQAGYGVPILPAAPNTANGSQPVTVPIPPVAVAPVPVPASNHTLIGVLELGKRSAALFEINGMTQRVNVGEEIAASGWTLVKVANKEAVIRRNGEVRSVYVGQKF